MLKKTIKSFSLKKILLNIEFSHCVILKLIYRYTIDRYKYLPTRFRVYNIIISIYTFFF